MTSSATPLQIFFVFCHFFFPLGSVGASSIVLHRLQWSIRIIHNEQNRCGMLMKIYEKYGTKMKERLYDASMQEQITDPDSPRIP